MKAYDLSEVSVLVVDDNAHMRRLVVGILGALGVRHTAEAEDGTTAFKELVNFQADVVVCDWSMQPMDGLKFTKMVRTDDDSPNVYVPIIHVDGTPRNYRVSPWRATRVLRNT